ncbi:hypothetical protein [Marinomonas pollencensis]|uniref:Uncharacterized protein n=1 Tax=Marinomonas pollencensis TaxID=491954 RepID=A0A3E0DJA6_9GAMM|nr:hypothetical protein [Marinomonas pollencensis]REG82150.1 hypothetical protein DFP81_11037 [Marinomonas pollencensis]
MNETIEKNRSSEERRFRLRLVLIFTPTIIGILVWINAELISGLLYLNIRFVLGVAAYLIAAGAAYFLMVYLKGGIKVPIVDRMANKMKPSWESQDSNSSIVQEDLDELKRKITEVSYAQIQLEEGQQEALINELKNTISCDLAAELEKEYSSAALTTAQMRQAKDNYRKSIDRLSKEIETLTRRANLNLVIGVLTTSIAVGLLTYMVLGTDAKLESLTGILSYYIPRVTVVIFIEVFSFFFLKMYKSNLTEIKYYQKEITNISTQQIVYESAVLSNENGALSSFVRAALNQSEETGTEQSKADTVDQIEHLSKVVQETSKIISNLSKSSKK